MFRALYHVGDWLMLGLKIQAYVVLRILRGGVVGGIFPAMLGTFRGLQQVMTAGETNNLSIRALLAKETPREAKLMNQLGYLFWSVLALLWVNHEIASVLPDMGWLSLFLLIALGFVASMWLSVIMLVAKYELPFGQYVYQSFLASVLGVVEHVATGLAMFLILVTGLAVPPVSFFIGAAALSLPHVWFSRSALARFERVVYQHKQATQQEDQP